MRRFLLIAALVLLPALTATADEETAYLLDEAWPRDALGRLSEIGNGVGVVFSPDLSVDGNCRFYTALGFACFQDADWSRVLDGIRSHNIFHPENRIRTLVLETHGTNGNGLKLQRSYEPNADRSYVSVGALQQRLEPDGVRFIIISACNSGRLLRPAIYRSLDPNPGDKLFLPATCGIIDATADFNPRRSRILVATPSSSHIETTLAANFSELGPSARRVLTWSAKQKGIKLPRQFAVSDIMMQMLLRDPSLSLSTAGYVDELSRDIQPPATSEKLFSSLLRTLNSIATDEARTLPPLVQPKRVVKKKAPARTARKPK